VATALSVPGSATYAINDLIKPLGPNVELQTGATIKTGRDSYADLRINGSASTIRVQTNSILELTTMDFSGDPRKGDKNTILTLKLGTVLYSVKRLTPNSHYEVRTPNGMAEVPAPNRQAGVLGTDFQVTVAQVRTGKFRWQFRETYVCVTGPLFVAAKLGGTNVTKLLEQGSNGLLVKEMLRNGPLRTSQSIFSLNLLLLQWSSTHRSTATALLIPLLAGASPHPPKSARPLQLLSERQRQSIVKAARRTQSWSELVSRRQEENGPDFGPNFAPPFQADPSAFAKEIGGLHHIEA